MGLKISDIITELSDFPLTLVCGNSAAEVTRFAGADTRVWEKETLHILPADKPLPEGLPPSDSCLILIGTDRLPERFEGHDDLNVLLLPEKDRTDELFCELDRLFSDEIFIAGAASRIFEALMRRKTPQALLDAASASLGLPIVISDFTHSIIAHTCPPELYGQADWDSYIAHGVVPEFIGENRSRLLGVICETPTGSLRLSYSPKRDVYNIFGDMIYEGESIGKISTMLDHGKPTRREKRILSIAHETLTILIGGNPESGFVRGDMMDTFLLRLIDGVPNPEQFLAGQERKLRYPNTGFFRVMVLDLENHKPFRRPIRSIISYLELICPNSISVMSGKTLVMLTNYSSAENVPRYSEPAFNDFVIEFNVHCGVSRTFEKLRHFSRAYSEALDAMEISQYINHPTPEKTPFRICHYDDTESCIEALRLYQNGVDLEARCHPHVLQLREYDEQFGSSYFETLQVYLECAMKTQPTAEKLCLHRNSLEYRLRKIKSITGLDWNNGDLMMRLHRSYVYLDFARAAAGRERFLRNVSSIPRINP